jgi:hypothetical protein
VKISWSSPRTTATSVISAFFRRSHGKRRRRGNGEHDRRAYVVAVFCTISTETLLVSSTAP